MIVGTRESRWPVTQHLVDFADNKVRKAVYGTFHVQCDCSSKAFASIVFGQRQCCQALACAATVALSRSHNYTLSLHDRACLSPKKPVNDQGPVSCHRKHLNSSTIHLSLLSCAPMHYIVYITCACVSREPDHTRSGYRLHSAIPQRFLFLVWTCTTSRRSGQAAPCLERRGSAGACLHRHRGRQHASKQLQYSSKY